MLIPATPLYRPFWQAIHDFQTVLASILGLISVGGALIGIKLQSYLGAKAAERSARQTRVSSAIMIRAILLSEKGFPRLSLLEPPTPKQVYNMLRTGQNWDLKTSDYLSYLSTMASSLTTFPRPIAERASFLTWISGRVLLATSQARSSELDEKSEAYKQLAEEVRLLLIAAITMAGELSYELKAYSESPETYERSWLRKREHRKTWWHWNVFDELKSNAFDLEAFRGRVFAIYEGTFNRAQREGELP